MGTKLHKMIVSMLLAGLAAALLAPPAEANRTPPPTTTTTTEPSYVPPPKYGRNPHPDVGPETDPYAGPPAVAPTVVPVDLGGVPPAVNDPGAGPSGDGNRLGPVQGDTPVDAPDVLAKEVTSPNSPVRGGIFAKTGANTMPLVRAGLAALALGAGFILLGRRRRAAAS